MARALYIHWPFCLKKCPYCDFNSHVRASVDHAVWQSALIADMEYEAKLAGGERLASIFFGGGTPSLMPPDLVGALLQRAEQLWGFEPGIEITLEANPSSVEASKFSDLALAGINRVSLGLQSLDDAQLRFLGRLHDADEGVAALGVAQKHFERVSFDLIYARPQQTGAQWCAELERALSFGTDHLSLYQLTIEPNTRFATDVRLGAFAPMENDPAADLFEITRELTAAAGIAAYEVSNHARTGQESRHNLVYWRYQDYCGIGPGAHGRRGSKATLRHKKPENWLASVVERGTGQQHETPLSNAESASEALLMGLRLTEGVSLGAIGERFGFAPSVLLNQDKVKLMTELGFVWENADRFGVTGKGMPLLDALLGELVSQELVLA